VVTVAALATAALVLLAAVGVVRRAPDDPERWHEDPVTADVGDRPNWFRLTPPDAPVDHRSEQEGVSPVVDVPVERLAAVFDDVASTDDRVRRLAGSPAAGFVTYVQRSAVVGFPDYISVRFMPSGAGRSTLAVYSRARYGYSDGGVNTQRVRRWVDETAQRLG
jgi:hypothetical protein